MDIYRILNFLDNVRRNNNRQWFQANKDEYLAVRADFENAVGELINNISKFDSTVSHITVKDATYRFNRDTRFSEDKSPYKRHFGAYIAAHGKKKLHGGYYVHLEPGNCMLACGSYFLPTNILTSCRNEIIANIDNWLSAVSNKTFTDLFVADSNGDSSGRGFGLERLKTVPKGFSRDYKYIEYLRMKDYCCWHNVPDDFFAGNTWIENAVEIFKAAKPMMDFVNSVIDDYE
ncbi:MAG: DUF2461 domain-containing protein [Prevotella sp.]|nr:DUF2461 domain-containing protein [Prevotella sp.]